MDLLAWIAADLDGLHKRLAGSVLAAVPVDRWHEEVDHGGSTITHLVLHLARHQDLAIATAIDGRAPLYAIHRYALGLADASPWAALAEREDRAVSAAVTPEGLAAYLDDVLAASAAWVSTADPASLETVPDVTARLVEHADLPVDELPWLHAMWTDRAVWWLLQWPVLGHGHAHVGEAISLRNRMGLSPF